MSIPAEKMQSSPNANPEQNIASQMQAVGRRARAASRELARAGTTQKNAALQALAKRLLAAEAELLAANQKDMAAGRENGLDAALLDRLELTPERIAAMADGVRQVAELPDPVGTIRDLRQRPSGIRIGHMRVPLGVVGIIYESRPNVTADAAVLCLKAGNAAVLRGGSEALHSNQAIAACIAEALVEAGLPAEAVQVIATTDRAAVGEMLRMPEYIDVVIPRGGKGLVAFVSEHARVPVIKHLDGVCHLYVDAAADLEAAIKVVENAKTQRYGTCNTLECLLVDASVADHFLPQLAEVMQPHQVELRACERSLPKLSGAVAAQPSDWGAEYLAPILAVRVVDGLDAAMDHIAEFSSRHTDGILTQDWSRANRFLREVDSASVMVNASTRFADGYEYGLGAEIGISTDKFHVRGPVGLEGLTSEKWVVFGDGQTR